MKSFPPDPRGFLHSIDPLPGLDWSEIDNVMHEGGVQRLHAHLIRVSERLSEDPKFNADAWAQEARERVAYVTRAAEHITQIGDALIAWRTWELLSAIADHVSEAGAIGVLANATAHRELDEATREVVVSLVRGALADAMRAHAKISRGIDLIVGLDTPGE